MVVLENFGKYAIFRSTDGKIRLVYIMIITVPIIFILGTVVNTAKTLKFQRFKALAAFYIM